MTDEMRELLELTAELYGGNPAALPASQRGKVMRSEDESVKVAVRRILRAGSTPTAEAIAQETQMPIGRVREALERLHGQVWRP